MRNFVQATLRRFGYQLVRNTRPAARVGVHSSPTKELPASVREELRPDHPKLRELRERYVRLGAPLAAHTWWTREYVDADLDLANFRGDNAYVWQTRHMTKAIEHRYFLYATDVASRDQLDLFSRIGEDGAFGCWVYRYHRFPALSRDLLDSVNELNFLQRHLGLSAIDQLSILDIGAGYGRLAHRSEQALPNLASYFCTDAVAESTFLSDFYTRYRNCSRSHVIAADELQQLDGRRIHLAINVHSFSEMSRSTIAAWLGLAERLNIRHLFVVPNDPEAFLSMESDGTRRDFFDLFTARGFRQVAKEPVIGDPDIRELVGVRDHMFLFARAAAE